MPFALDRWVFEFICSSMIELMIKVVRLFEALAAKSIDVAMELHELVHVVNESMNVTCHFFGMICRSK